LRRLRFGEGYRVAATAQLRGELERLLASARPVAVPA
jgi:hypothetical protein